ncbi:MAG: cupin domain-containing protein [Anaerolineales bacterium]|nr:MAG: cupin domain-containing protein [Anaerolineales bacterium]
MTPDINPTAVFIPEGGDRFSTERGMGITSLRYKVVQEETNGRLFVIEQTMHAKGGPPRHLHLEQEEWFYSIRGHFILEIGEEQYTLTEGDSVLAPRAVPHVWAFVGDSPGRILIAFTPAGKMKEFFDETVKSNGMPGQDPAFWEAHGMELLGPPLRVE